MFSTKLPVSVVIPCYRCASTVSRAIESIAKQTQIPSEVILVDDASDDGTVECLRALEMEYMGWIKVIIQAENVGAATARNIGWNMANQSYITFLDADDAWHPRKLEIQYAYMKAHPDVVLCGHAHRQLSNADTFPDWVISKSEYKLISKNEMLLSNRFVTPSVMLKRDIPFRFKADQRYMEDHLLWSEIVCSGFPTVRLSAELVAIYKPIYGASGLSAQMWPMAKSDVQNYGKLFKKGFISIWKYLGFSLYASMKFVRRMLIFWWRKLREKNTV